MGWTQRKLLSSVIVNNGIIKIVWETKLVLSSNQITDVSPLAKLTGLTELGVDGNQIVDRDLEKRLPCCKIHW